MNDRHYAIAEFLDVQGLKQARRIALPSDASFRRYERVVMDDGRHFILMDAPPKTETILPFIYVDHYLREHGLSAPKIYAQDTTQGFMLLEDLGDARFTQLLMPDAQPSDEPMLYCEAIAALVHLQRQTPPLDLPHYDHALLMREVELFVDWYLPHVVGHTASENIKNCYRAIWDGVLAAHVPDHPVVVLRDYHADNLMWLPDRKGIERVGLLDFQDAVVGSPIYDLISLLEDARRDVAPQTVDAAIAFYMNASPQNDPEVLLRHYAVYAAQRNCKILGIFARLAVRDQKRRYLEYMPRVWKHLEHDMQHPALESLRLWFDTVIPSPDRVISAFTPPSLSAGEPSAICQ